MRLDVCSHFVLDIPARFWVHISFDPRLRRQVLTRKPGGGYALGLMP